MKLDILISNGESIVRDLNSALEPERVKARSNLWVRNCNEFLDGTYPDSVITKDFKSMEPTASSNLGDLVSILKGLRDVEEDIGELDK